MPYLHLLQSRPGAQGLSYTLLGSSLGERKIFGNYSSILRLYWDISNTFWWLGGNERTYYIGVVKGMYSLIPYSPPISIASTAAQARRTRHPPGPIIKSST